MKILQFINSLDTGGAEKLVIDLSISYYKRGVYVDILLLKGGSSLFKEKLKKYPKIKIFDLGNNNIYNPKYIFMLNSYFRKYDVIHVHLFPSLYWASLANFFSSTNHNLILTEHSTSNKRRKNLFRFLDRFIYKQFRTIVAISDTAAINLSRHLGRSFDNILNINNGIDLEVVRGAQKLKRSDLGLKTMDYILIQVSSFRYPKDQKTVIRALRRLPKNVHLLLIGDGPSKNENADFSIELGLSERVHFLGLRNDVPELLKTADIAILSSYYEGLSLSSVEGLASGRPFIASDVPGLAEVVRNAGLLFPTNNDEKLAELILELISNKEFYMTTANKGKKRAEMFNIENTVDQYLKLYNTN